jgi:hypothetical protein
MILKFLIIHIKTKNDKLERLYLLLPSKIKEYKINGLKKEEEPFVIDYNNDENSNKFSSEIEKDVYIDVDRVGILVE